MSDFASTLRVDGRDSECTLRMPGESPSGGDEIAEPVTAPGTPETMSLLGRHAPLETDADESTPIVEHGQPLPLAECPMQCGVCAQRKRHWRKRSKACGSTSTYPYLYHDCAYPAGGTSTYPHLCHDCALRDNYPDLYLAWLRDNYTVAMEDEPSSQMTSDDSDDFEKGINSEKGGPTPFSDLGRSLSESKSDQKPVMFNELESSGILQCEHVQWKSNVKASRRRVSIQTHVSDNPDLDSPLEVLMKSADPGKDVSTVIDAQEEDLITPCGAAGEKRSISEDTSTGGGLTPLLQPIDICMVPKDDEFWVEFRKRQQFLRDLELKRNALLY